MSYLSLDTSLILEQIKRHTHSELAKQRVEFKLINSRLKLERELKRQEKALQASIQYGSPSFHLLLDCQQEISLVKKGGFLSVEELLIIGKLLICFESVRNYRKHTPIQFELLDDFFDSIGNFSSVLSLIQKSFSDDGSVNDHASETLFSIRKKLNSMDLQINKTISTYISNNKEKLTSDQPTIKNNRVVLPFLSSHKNTEKGLIHDQSASGQTTFIEPQFLLDLNNEKQFLINEEHQEIIRICKKISSLIEKQADEIISSLESCVYLDSYFGRANWAKEYDGSVAKLSSDSLYLKNVVHPLLPRETAVRNTFELMSPHKLILMTGPNTGGKTVGLKSIGLCLLMTLSGFPIPCEEGVIPFVQKLFVDIGDTQSITSSLSTFSGHLSYLAEMIEVCDENSFVFLDELGSGTDPLEGEMLAMAIVEELINKGCFGVITTHYGLLKQLAVESQTILESSMEFNLETLKPTYKYLQGQTGQSYGIDIAKQLKLKESIINRAIQLKKEHQSESLKLLEKLSRQIEENRMLAESLEEERTQQIKLKEEYDIKLRQLENEKESILQSYKLKQEQNLNHIIKEATALIDQLKQSQDLKSSQDIVLKIEKFKHKEQQITSSLEKVDIGERVFVKTINQYGVVTAFKKDQIQVDVNGMKLTVKLDQLMKDNRLEEKPKKKRKVYGVTHNILPMGNLQRELNIIGLRFEQAMQEVDYFIDQCLVHKIGQGRIVHGFGTGALREGTHQKLKKHPRVASFEFAAQSSGGQGATIVKFKI